MKDKFGPNTSRSRIKLYPHSRIFAKQVAVSMSDRDLDSRKLRSSYIQLTLEPLE